MSDRFFYPGGFETDKLTLTGTEAHHLLHVLRAQPGKDPASRARRHALAAAILRVPQRLESRAQLREVIRLRDAGP